MALKKSETAEVGTMYQGLWEHKALRTGFASVHGGLAVNATA